MLKRQTKLGGRPHSKFIQHNCENTQFCMYTHRRNCGKETLVEFRYTRLTIQLIIEFPLQSSLFIHPIQIKVAVRYQGVIDCVSKMSNQHIVQVSVVFPLLSERSFLIFFVELADAWIHHTLGTRFSNFGESQYKLSLTKTIRCHRNLKF